MRSLLSKELFALRPYLWATLVLGGVLLISDLLSETFLMGPAQALVHDMDGWLVLSGTLTFALAHASVAPEVRLGHVHFLDALPVTRRQIFAMKVAAGLCVVTAVLVVTGSLKLFAAWGTVQPHTGSAASLLGALFVHHAAGLIAFYGMGALLSWLGGLGWVLLLLGYTAVFVIAESSPALRPLSLFHGYGTVRFDQGRALVLMWPAQVWLTFGVVATALSGLLFLGPGGRLIEGGSRWQGKAQRALVLVISLLFGLFGLLAFVGLVGPAGDRLLQRAHRVQRGGFEVLVAQDSRTEAAPLVLRLPQIDEAVRRVMQQSDPLNIAIEMTGGGRYHSGQYTGGKIRMSPAKDGATTLAHELAHAYAHRAGGPTLNRNHDHLRFFNEGLAMWVADQAIGTSSTSDAFRAWAGAIWQMGHHPFDALTEDRARGQQYDPFEAYPLGLVFVEALVDEAGPGAPIRLLDAIRALPSGTLSGRTIWYRLAHACDLDLQSVLRHYEARLRAYAQRWPHDVQVRYATPLLVDGDIVLLTADSPGTKLRCRFRSRRQALPTDLQERSVGNGVCRVATYDASEGTISFQVGQTLEGGWTVFGPWAEAPVPR